MTRPVKLLDGRTVDSSSEPWRFECEARAVVLMLEQSRQNSYLNGVEHRRGFTARDTLEQFVMEHRVTITAQHIMGLPTLKERRDYLEALEDARGRPHRDNVEDELSRLWYEDPCRRALTPAANDDAPPRTSAA